MPYIVGTDSVCKVFVNGTNVRIMVLLVMVEALRNSLSLSMEGTSILTELAHSRVFVVFVSTAFCAAIFLLEIETISLINFSDFSFFSTRVILYSFIGAALLTIGFVFNSSGFGRNFLINPSVQPRCFNSELRKLIFFFNHYFINDLNLLPRIYEGCTLSTFRCKYTTLF